MFGRKAKIRKAVDRALAGIEAEADLADHAPIEALPATLQLQAYYTLVLALHEDERHAAAKHTLGRALALAPDNPELQRLASAIASELGDVDDAIAAQRRAVAAAPRDTAAVATLADLLIGAERIDEVIERLTPLRGEHDPELDTKLAEALFVSGKNDEAFGLLDEVGAHYEAQLKRTYGPEWQEIKRRADDAERLRLDVYAEMHGREATRRAGSARGQARRAGRRQLPLARRKACGDEPAHRRRAGARVAGCASRPRSRSRRCCPASPNEAW